MKSKLIICTALFLFALSCKNESPKQEPNISEPTAKVKPSVQLVWESDTTLITPESVIYDEKLNCYYVSCINGVPPLKKDVDGYITKLDAQGKTINLKWIRGLSAPKGMAIQGDTLFVTDITDLVIISISQAKILNRITIKDAIFLNDIAIDKSNGVVYFTDTETNSIHKFTNGAVSDFIKNDTLLGYPNGVYIDNGQLIGSSFTKGHVYSVDLLSKKMVTKVDTLPGGDGIEKMDGGYLASNWNGEVYYIDAKWKKHILINTVASKRNAADIGFNINTKIMTVPEFFGNKVSAYKID
jgi:DNA-binding beta-propeller fold protein YncE